MATSNLESSTKVLDSSLTQDLLNSIDWQKSPLIPTIAQDFKTKEVLMLAFSNELSLNLTLETKHAHYFSRSKARIWRKGEQSGHIQEIVEVRIDCDSDALLFLVKQHGVACHTGNMSCFFRKIDFQSSQNTQNPQSTQKIDIKEIYGIIDSLYHTILERKTKDPKSSYVASLFTKGENAICKKIIEEAGELTFALKDGEQKDIIYECADLVFHSLVGLASKDISPDRIRQELKRREGVSGIAEKNSRKS